MQIADLHQRLAGKRLRQVRHRKPAANELEPVRLDLRCVPDEPGADDKRSAGGDDECAAVQLLALRRFAIIIGPTTNGMWPIN
jgi:hypothetical protein